MWLYPRQQYLIQLNNQNSIAFDTCLNFFYAANGRANGFRFKDPIDSTTTTTTGLLGAGIGTGLPTYQLRKRYTVGSTTADRLITKPITVSVFRSAAPVTVGAGAGQIAINMTTGIVTFVADASQSVTAMTGGATTSVTLAAALAPLAIGESLYISGVVGTIATAVNGIAHPITNIVGAVYTLSTNTTGLTRTSGGTGFAYPQSGEPLTWSGTFDVAVRFDTDMMEAVVNRTSIGGSISWDVRLIETRGT
jgi:uncharacterized protein (TIGR02217 family)